MHAPLSHAQGKASKMLAVEGRYRIAVPHRRESPRDQRRRTLPQSAPEPTIHGCRESPCEALSPIGVIRLTWRECVMQSVSFLKRCHKA
jgi:hypothetical protein